MDHDLLLHTNERFSNSELLHEMYQEHSLAFNVSSSIGILMKAFVVHAPGESSIEEIDDPVAKSGEVVVDVLRAGVCGTDVEFFDGDMAYFSTGEARYPIRLGHEWCGVVTSVEIGRAHV